VKPKEQAREHFAAGDSLAWVKHKTGAALKEYRAALELDPGMAEAHWRIGQIYYFAKRRDLKAALHEFREAIRLKPDWSEAHLCAANALADLGQLSLSIKEYRKAIRLDASDSRARISLGVCLSKSGRYVEAIKAYREGICLKPTYGEMSARMLLADALIASGRAKEAAKELETVLEMEPVWDYEKTDYKRAKEMIARYNEGRD
jgi:Tfp pilus assembly protein PilF